MRWWSRSTPRRAPRCSRTTVELYRSVAETSLAASWSPGAGADHTIADPTGEAALGFVDRNAVSPLEQLRTFSGRPGAFNYVPAFDSTGRAVPPTALSTGTTAPPTAATGGLTRTSGPGSPRVDRSIEFTSESGSNRLAPGNYSWTGYVYVPTADTYTFELQQSADVASGNVSFSLDGAARTLTGASPVYFNGGNSTVATGPRRRPSTSLGARQRLATLRAA